MTSTDPKTSCGTPTAAPSRGPTGGTGTTSPSRSTSMASLRSMASGPCCTAAKERYLPTPASKASGALRLKYTGCFYSQDFGQETKRKLIYSLCLLMSNVFA